MKQDKLLLDLPRYHVKYTKAIYSYEGKGRENLKAALYSESKGYCMYCYRRIKVDGEEYGQLEHAIEASIFMEKLKNCVPNIGIACSNCNNIYKKVGQKNRIPNRSAIQEFAESAKCTQIFCKQPCEAYKKLKRSYLQKKKAQFIMQPMGVTSLDIGLSGNKQMLLQYDFLKHRYLPSNNEDY